MEDLQLTGFPPEDRARQADKIVKNPANYKICEGCDSIVLAKAHTCPNCASYRFQEGPASVVAQARLLGKRELQRVADAVQERCRSPRDLVWIDFSDVAHLDFRALAEFVQSQERQRHRGTSIWITGLTPYLRALFHVAGQGPALSRLEWRVPVEEGGRMGREDARRSYGSAPDDGTEPVEI